MLLCLLTLRHLQWTQRSMLKLCNWSADQLTSRSADMLISWSVGVVLLRCQSAVLASSFMWRRSPCCWDPPAAVAIRQNIDWITGELLFWPHPRLGGMLAQSKLLWVLGPVSSFASFTYRKSASLFCADIERCGLEVLTCYRNLVDQAS